MLIYPELNPIALQLGPLTIYWYGVMYVIGFIAAFWSCAARRLTQTMPWQADDIIDLFFYAAVGVIFGGTWGYLLFYEPFHALLADPLNMLQFWKPGRSFHGGLIGVLIALLVFSKKHKRPFWTVTDFIAPAVPLGIMMGRLGNFINGELWGRTTNMPWGMVFPHAGTVPRHPSQLYELALEGIVLFLILQYYIKVPRARAAVSGMFLVWYGIFRCLVEFFREPDFNQGFLTFGWITKGQMLSLPMIALGLLILFYAQRSAQKGRKTACKHI